MPSPLHKIKGVEALAASEMEVAGKKKDHPSISDYYKAQSNGKKQITYQHGLSNFSSVQLGDDRVSFKKSLSQDVYKFDDSMEEKTNEEDNKKAFKTDQQRKHDYIEATQIVGDHKITQMEQMMRDKLQQRTKTGPFQLRKTFKYFDRDGSGGIDFDEFQRAMELMGFQFTEIQQLALFARYDSSCAGEVDYTEFVSNLMESDFKGVISTAQGGRFMNRVKKTFSAAGNGLLRDNDGSEEEGAGDDDSDVDSDEQEAMNRIEVAKIFHLIDVDNSNFIDKRELNLLLIALGRRLTKDELDKGWEEIDGNKNGTIEFDEFYEWFTKNDL